MSAQASLQSQTIAKPAFTPVASGVLQRCTATTECDECRKKREGMLQRAAVNNSPTHEVSPIVHEVLRSPGLPLDTETRAFMEPRFGHDFSGVRVHTNAKAAESARAVNALAYTAGPDMVFGADQYAPITIVGRKLIAHELTHVVQQRNAHATLQGKLTLGAVDDSYEREANNIAEAVSHSNGQADSAYLTLQADAALQRACGPTAIGAPAGCTPVSGDIVGERFLFRINCDEFLRPTEQTRLELFADTIANGERIDIHGYASVDGAPDFNENLSCARALRAQAIIQSILTGKGVSASVSAFMHGANPGSNPAEQRSVVIDRSGVVPASPTPVPAPAPTPTPTPSTPPPAPGTQSCAPSQTTMLTAELNDARTWVTDAESKISAVSAATASPSVASIVNRALTDNFHTTTPADVATIAAYFALLKTALTGSFTFECASSFWCNPNELAYVRGGLAFVRRLFDINVCPLWFSCGNYFKRVSALVHERAHQYPGATDNAYEWQASYATLSASRAIDNAESYAVAARQIYHSGAHGPGETC